MERRNIVFIIESAFPCYTGGIENWLYNVITRLPNEYQVTVVSATPSANKIPFYSVPANINLIHFQTLERNRLLRSIFCKTRLRKFEILFHARVIKKVLDKVVIAPNETVLVALGTIAVSMAAVAYKKQNNDVRFICSSRGPHAEVESKRHGKIKDFLYKKEFQSISSADLFLVNGYDTRDYYIKLAGVTGMVLLNGVDVHGFSEDNHPSPYSYGKPVIVSVGTVIDIKGVNELIKAFAILRNQYRVDAALCFVGKGATAKYEALSSSLGIAEDVHFLGNQKNVKPFLKHATIAACLSGGGGFSMAALEAMASKTPIVAWDSPVYQQFNTEIKTMELVKTGSIDALSDKMLDMLLNLDVVKKNGENAWIVAKDYDWANVIKNLVCFFYDNK